MIATHIGYEAQQDVLSDVPTKLAKVGRTLSYNTFHICASRHYGHGARALTGGFDSKAGILRVRRVSASLDMVDARAREASAQTDPDLRDERLSAGLPQIIEAFPVCLFVTGWRWCAAH